MIYSHTRLSAFEDCPLKFKYQYLDRHPSARGRGIEAFLGNRVHEALEKLYRDLRMTRLPALEEVIAFYRDSWERNWEDSVRIIKKEYAAEDYFRKGEKCLAGYYQRYRPFQQGMTIGIEETVKVDLGEGRLLTGKIDRLVDGAAGRYEIHDYKTGDSLPTQAEADADRQLALYQIGVENMWTDVREVELVWHYLVFDKEIRSHRSPPELESLRESVNRLIDSIENARDYPAHRSALCDWCDYQDICPEWKHLFQTEALSPREYKENEGVSLVDGYLDVLDREKAVKARKEELRKAIIEFAASFGYEVVYGSGHKIKLSRRPGIRLPSPRDETREKLEELIRSAGEWDEVSDLSAYRLEKALRAGRLPEALAAAVRAVCPGIETVTLKTSRFTAGGGGTSP